MRNAISIFGALIVAACSVDHIVVAALDDTGSASTGGMFDSAGSSGLSASAAGTVTSGGSRSAGPDRIILVSGGTTSDVRIDSDAGAADASTTEVLCSCDGGQSSSCGSDGITYPTSCDDGGTCFPPSIACFHACPCLEAEPVGAQVTSWFSVDCDPTKQCAGGFICLMFSGAKRQSPNCAPASN